MTATLSIDPDVFLHEQLAQASPDLMRELLTTFINALLSAQADSVCGAEYGARDPERTNRRNGYRHRDLDTRAGTIDVAIPKLREGSFFPDWLLEPASPGRGRADHGGRDLLPARGLHPPDGPVGAFPEDYRPVQVAGVGDGRRPRRAGRRVPEPPAPRGPRTRSSPPMR